ncbi:hypothetical protein TRFO_16703 [Tritrichomonas foetus]|uniref:Uncharacterized protein n=1 Tax=Tritrichomonas foetus TaxID=1144522 RepID=A0A1J4KPT2_9EUKA|nr:hypothetical protein TRFO_16703 [Tritrichomonas foetus]|eukprot:OHT13251.1 hypothetical protein TRFO_16703 [Tritrichomonas foetus]
MYPNIDEEKITSLLSFIGNLSKSSQEELANFSDSSYRIVTNYYTQLFVPIYTNMNHQFLRMQLAQPKTNFDNFGKDKSENPTDQPFDQI